MFDTARLRLREAVAARAFPAAAIEVGNPTQPIWREAFGRLLYGTDAPAAAEDTIFDLASLTKVIATTPMVMQLVERGVASLDDRVAMHLPSWAGSERADVTIEDLLAHCAGLDAHAPLFEQYRGRTAFEHAIASRPLAYPPRTRSVYSDLGFMLLAFIIEDAGCAPLDARFTALLTQMHIAEEMQYNPPALWARRIAPTEQDPWRGRLLVGEVHDENASALGGVAGHAGLFGTVASVGAYARHLLQVLDGRTGAFRRDTLVRFTSRREGIPGSSRALGWDTMLSTSSCGTLMSAHAFGHTGFTGTSLWIDPERAVYVALLTNRVHPTRNNDAIKAVRPAVHDAVMQEFL